MLCFYMYCSQVTKAFRARYKILYDSVRKQGDFIMLWSLLAIYQGEVIFFSQRKFCKKGVFVVFGVLHSMKVCTHMVTGCFECTGEFF